MGLHFGTALASAGIDLRYKTYSYRWHYYYAAQMHHKTVIVDGDTVASGSYNFSPNAEFSTFENIVFYESYRNPEVVEAFVDNFESIWDTGAGLYEPLLAEIRSSDDGWFPIIFDSMALSWDQVSQLKEAIRTHCADIDSDSFKQEPWKHANCQRTD